MELVYYYVTPGLSEKTQIGDFVLCVLECLADWPRMGKFDSDGKTRLV